MKSVISALLGFFKGTQSRRPANQGWSKPRFRPTFELLEDRSVPSTLSSIASNFNGTAIPAGDSIWFNAAFKASGLGAGPVSIHVTDQSIAFPAGGNPYNVSVPDSILNFSAANTVATTSFDAGQNAWVTNLPMSWSGNAFLAGASFFATNGLPGGINPVTWTGSFATDTAGVTVKWQWGAAVYTSFSSDNNALNVKPLDSGSATIYQNSDHAGTPEAFKSFVIGGARGGGGSNWTGSYSSTGNVTPAVENFSQPATLSGRAIDTNGFAIVNATIRLRDSNNVVIATVTTDVNGYYQITAIPAGSGYSLSITRSGYTPFQAIAGTDNGVTDGTDGVGIITDISLNSGDAGINYNFVMFPPPA